MESPCILLDKCCFFVNYDDVEKLSKKVFIIGDDGEPRREHEHFEDKDFNNWTTRALLVLQEKTCYAHDDKSVRPFIMIETAGPYLNESEIKRVWLAFINIEKIEIVHT